MSQTSGTLTDLLQGLGDLGPVFFDTVADTLSVQAPLPPSQAQLDLLHERQQSSSSDQCHLPAPRTNSFKRSRSGKGIEEELNSKLLQLNSLSLQNQLLRERVQMLEKVVQARTEQTQRLQSVEAGQLPAADPLTGFGLTIEQWKKMTCREFAQWAKQTMLQLGADILSSEAGLSSVTADGSSAVVSKMKGMTKAYQFAILIRPDLLLLSGRNINEMDGPDYATASLAPDDHWGSVVRQLQLAEGQVLQAWVLFDLYTRWHDRILADRSRLSTQLSELLSVNKYTQAYMETSSMLARATESELLDKLQSSIVKERVLMFLITEVMFTQILHPEQIAKMCVYSYPYLLDDIATLAAMASLHQPKPTGVAGVIAGRGL